MIDVLLGNEQYILIIVSIEYFYNSWGCCCINGFWDNEKHDRENNDIFLDYRRILFEKTILLSSHL